MPKTHRVLVVASGATLRQSLQFALEAEGYAVKLCNGIDSCQHAPAEFDCTVLDHHATGKDIAAARAFCTQHAPVVLLANAAEHSLTSSAFLTVTKPTLGAALLYAVRAAIEARSITT